VCAAQLMLAVDITIIPVARVQIKRALGFGEADLSWLVTGYALPFGRPLLAGSYRIRSGIARCSWSG
jgi:hypothetical protein